LVRIFGFSSRNQQDKNKYIETLDMRLDAKYKRTPQEVLDRLGVTHKDLNKGLKLPINAYTGALRATFNALYDPLQGFSICTTGQLLILQLIYDLQKVPTLEMVSANTDAVMFTINEEYKQQAVDVLDAWQKHTRLELEEDKIVKIIMRDVNNYCEIVQTGDDDYEVHYKGGEFKGIHDFKWNKEKKTFEYSFTDDIEANSLTIIGEALLKNLLFDIPIEDTINNCDDIFRFQMITHLGHTYEKMVQESINGDIELQRNNRVYAGKKPSGTIIKVKYNGRRDSLANCPPNPIIDNANQCTIDDINKGWYIKYAKQKLNDFKGVRRLEDYKKEELLEKATSLGLEVDKKIKKADLIKLIEDEIESREINGEPPINPWDIEEEKVMEETKQTRTKTVYEKINDLKQDIMKKDFTMDKAMPNNLGGGEYASIGQYYRAINELSVKHGLLFMWDVMDTSDIEKELFKPQGRTPQHVVTVVCEATFVDVETGDEVEYRTCASGSDICDKAVSGASTMAFRNWFDKNFAPKHLSDDMFGGDEEVIETSEQTAEPKIPTYIPPEKKAELAKEVVAEKQVVDSDSNDIQNVINKIMEVRELSGKADWGASTLQQLIGGEITSENLMEIELKVDNKLDSLK
jgi:hypothetical protein